MHFVWNTGLNEIKRWSKNRKTDVSQLLKNDLSLCIEEISEILIPLPTAIPRGV